MPCGSDAVVATLRSTPLERLLLVANLSDAPVSGYALDLPAGALCGSPTAEAILGARAVGSPMVLPDGSVTGYRPFSTLAPRSVAIVALNP